MAQYGRVPSSLIFCPVLTKSAGSRGREVRNEEFRIISWSLYELPVFKELLLLDGIC
jgi:hypothetical protein